METAALCLSSEGRGPQACRGKLGKPVCVEGAGLERYASLGIRWLMGNVVPGRGWGWVAGLPLGLLGFVVLASLFGSPLLPPTG